MSTILKAHKGGILTSLTVVLALLGLFAAGYSSMNHRPKAPIPTAAHTAKAKRAIPPNPGEVRLVLHRVGLDAEALAACGLSANQATAIITAARSQIADSIQTIRQAEADLSAAAATRDGLQLLARSGRSTEQDDADLVSATAAFASARSTLQSALDAVFTAATTDLTSDTKALLQTLLANRGHHLPAKYLTASRSDADWLAISDAWDNKRVADRTGDTPDPTLANALASFDNSQSVSAATANLQANLPSINAAWIQATE